VNPREIAEHLRFYEELGVTGAKHRHGRVDATGVGDEPAEEPREQELAAGQSGQQIPDIAQEVASGRKTRLAE